MIHLMFEESFINEERQLHEQLLSTLVWKYKNIIIYINVIIICYIIIIYNKG